MAEIAEQAQGARGSCLDENLVIRLLEFAEHCEGVDPGFVAVGKVKVEGVAADDGDVIEMDIVGDGGVVEYLLAGPFVDAGGARAGTAEIDGAVLCLFVVRPGDG